MTEHKSGYDILIVGAGFVGCVLAHALNQQGFKVALIEQKALHIKPQHAATRDNRSIVLTYSSYQILKALSIWPKLADFASPVKTVKVTHAGHFGSLIFHENDCQLPLLGYVVPANVLTDVLQELVLVNPNIELISPASSMQINFVDQMCQVNVITDEEKQLTAPLLIGADGAPSQVRQSIGIKTKNIDYQQSAVIAIVDVEKHHQQIAFERLTKTGAIALLPRGEKKCGMVWTMPSENVELFLKMAKEEILEKIQKAWGYQLGRFLNISECQAYPLQLQTADEQMRPNVLLLGNAAHTLHPIAGQGFNLGLRDLALLVEILADAKRNGTSLNDIGLLEKYLDQRRRDQNTIVRFTDGIVRLFSHEFLAMIGGAGFSLINNISPVKKLLIRNLLGYSGKASKLSCGVIP